MVPAGDGVEPAPRSPRRHDRTALDVPACEVRIGDDVLVRDEYCEVVKVRNAQGRKPPTGFNLHLLTTGRMLRVHSAQLVSVRRRAVAHGTD